MSKRKDRLSRTRFRIGAAQIQPDRLAIVLDGEEHAIEPRVMEVLIHLAENAGATHSAEAILLEVWKHKFFGDNPVHKAITALRKAFGDDAKAPRYIETIRKRGYRLVATVAFPDDYRRIPLQDRDWRGGSPYVGLDAFDDTHADVFHGRSRMVAECLTAMRRQIEQQRRFVLVVGASGCGKTSLLNAGVVPRLRQSGGFDGLEALSIARCNLAGTQADDPVRSLAGALATWTLGPRKVFTLEDADDLAAWMSEGPQRIGAAIDDAFRKLASRDIANQPDAHLLLLIDHAEALVSGASRDPERQAVFERIVHALCESPRVFVIMIVRGDFYLSLIETFPGIADRKGSDGHLDVLTPGRGELAQIIRLPAAIAGLTFEEDAETGNHLDDVLRDAAIAHPDALPLLQHTLQALYERRSDDGELRFPAYRDIGGLEGALAHRAEEVFCALPGQIRQSLDRVLSRMIAMQPEHEGVSAQRIDRTVLDPDALALVQAFVSARLFVAERDGDRSIYRVAHEALLRQWPRAVDWARDNRRLLQARGRLQRSTARWMEEGKRQDHLLNPGRPLIEALEVARRHQCSLSQEEHAFLKSSQLLFRKRQWMRSAAIGSLIVLTALSTALAGTAMRSKSLAEQHRDSLVKQANAFRNVGELVFRNANIKDAESALATIESTLQSAKSASPENESLISEYGVWNYWLGYYHLQEEQLQKADVHWKRYLESSRQLVELSPDNPGWNAELSFALNNIGNLAAKRLDYDNALENFIESERIKRRELERNKDNLDLAYDHIDTLSWIGSMRESTGAIDAAARDYADVVYRLRRLIEQKNEVKFRRKLAIELWRSARLASATKSIDVADAAIEESTSILTDIVRVQPNDQARRDLANALNEAGLIASARGDKASAIYSFDAAMEQMRLIPMDTDSRPSWIRLRETIRINQALHSSPDRGAAIIDDAIRILRSLVKEYPDELHFAIDLANACIARALIHDANSQLEQKNEHLACAMTLLFDFAKNSRNPSVLGPFAQASALRGEHFRSHEIEKFLTGIGYDRRVSLPFSEKRPDGGDGDSGDNR